MKFSIITATYNREESIYRSLESVKKQTFKDTELVIIDGLSKDRTLSIIKPLLTDSDICISEKDNGIYDALNKGISNANGDIIGFLHSDDMFFDNYVLEEVASIFDSSDVDIVYGDAVFFKNDNEQRVVRYYNSDKFSTRNLSWGKMPAHTAMFIRKEVYDKYGTFKINYSICADYEFLCRISKHQSLKSTYISKPFVKMQIGGVSTGGIKNTILLNREVLRACLENNIDTNILKILSKYPSKLIQFILPRIK